MAATTAAVVGAGAAAASAASSFRKGGGGGGTPGMAGGFEVVTLPTYDFTEPRFRSMSDFVKQQFDSIAQGGVPMWLERQLPTIRQGLNRQLEAAFYGLPGQRTGAIPTALQAAAITGAGSGVAQRQVSKQLQNYSEQAKRIDEFIAQETLSGTQQTIRDAGAIGLGIPQGPPSTVVGPFGYAPQQAPSMQGPLSALSGVLGGMFGGGSGGNQSSIGNLAGQAIRLMPSGFGNFDTRFLNPNALNYQNVMNGLAAPQMSFPNRYEQFMSGALNRVGTPTTVPRQY